jgi:hypothetical protein
VSPPGEIEPGIYECPVYDRRPAACRGPEFRIEMPDEMLLKSYVHGEDVPLCQVRDAVENMPGGLDGLRAMARELLSEREETLLKFGLVGMLFIRL